MRAIRITVLTAVFALGASGFAAVTASKPNCQQQAGGTTTSKDKRERTAEAIRVYEGAAKPGQKKIDTEATAVREKGA